MKKIIGYELKEEKNCKVVIAALGLYKNHSYKPFILPGMLSFYIPKIEELGIIDWFEPVYEKEYEILSFKKPYTEKHGDNLFKIRDKNGLFTWDYTNSKDTEKDLIERKFEIYSVKRVSL